MVVTNMSEVNLVARCREINFGFGRRLYMRCCLRKEINGIAWLLGDVCRLKGIGRETSKRECPLPLGEEGS